MRYQDGVESDHRCPNCFEPNGGPIQRELEGAAAKELAASISAKCAPPPKFPYWLDDLIAGGVITRFDPAPRRLTRGGSSATLTIYGSGLQTTDTIAYGHAGITNASAAVLTPVTYDSDGNALTPFEDVLVLTVQASGAVPLGYKTLTYNDVIHHNAFDVRA